MKYSQTDGKNRTNFNPACFTAVVLGLSYVADFQVERVKQITDKVKQKDNRLICLFVCKTFCRHRSTLRMKKQNCKIKQKKREMRVIFPFLFVLKNDN